MVDERFWGIVALSISFTALVTGILYAANWRSGHRREEESAAPLPPLPVAPEVTYSYTCHCHRNPVHVTVPAHRIPRICGRGKWLP